MPHMPQLPGSVVGFTQVPPQHTSSLLQARPPQRSSVILMSMLVFPPVNMMETGPPVPIRPVRPEAPVVMVSFGALPLIGGSNVNRNADVNV